MEIPDELAAEIGAEKRYRASAQVVLMVALHQDEGPVGFTRLKELTGINQSALSVVLAYVVGRGWLEGIPLKDEGRRLHYRIGKVHSVYQSQEPAKAENHTECTFEADKNTPSVPIAESGSTLSVPLSEPRITPSVPLPVVSTRAGDEHNPPEEEVGNKPTPVPLETSPTGVALPASNGKKPRRTKGQRGITDPLTAEAFERWYDLYGVKVGGARCAVLFANIPREDWPLLKEATLAYVAVTVARPESSDSRMRQRRDPERFLKDDYWRDWAKGDPRASPGAAAQREPDRPDFYVNRR